MIKNKFAQITIFVIIALIIVVAIALIFTLSQQPFFGKGAAENPQEYIADCAKKPAEEAAKMIMLHGGYIEPREPYLIFDNEKTAYLCHASDNDELCTSIEPMLIEKIEEEVYNYINPKVEDCFKSLEESLKNYNYLAEPTSLEVEIKPKQILVKISKKVSFVKNEKSINLEVFDAIISSPIYDFAVIINDIINQEVDCDCGNEACNADVFNVAGSHDFEIERFVTGGNEKVYTIREIVSGKEFVFAVRNCVRMP